MKFVIVIVKRHLIALFLSLAFFAATAYSLPAPRGLLIVDNTKNNPPQKDNLLDVRTSAGLCEYVKWSELEPSEGNYTCEPILALLKDAQAKKKKVALGILAGIHLPPWYKSNYPAQVFRYIRFQKREDVGTILLTNEAVLPWIRRSAEDSSGKRYVLNVAFFKAFHKMLSALSNRLKQEGLTDSLAYVSITGPGTHNGLEMQLALMNGEDWKRLDWCEETRGLWSEAWVYSARAFREIFPNTPLTLAFADSYGSKPASSPEQPQPLQNASISRGIVEAVMAQENPSDQRIFPMGLWLAEWNRWDGTHPLCNILLEQRKKGFAFGLQAHLMKHANLTALQITLNKAVEAGSDWIELWYPDVSLPDFETAIRKVLPQFEK